MAARAGTVARAATQGLFKQVLEDIRAAGTWKAERIITSPQAASIAVSTSKTKASIQSMTPCIFNFMIRFSTSAQTTTWGFQTTSK